MQERTHEQNNAKTNYQQVNELINATLQLNQTETILIIPDLTFENAWIKMGIYLESGSIISNRSSENHRTSIFPTNQPDIFLEIITRPRKNGGQYTIARKLTKRGELANQEYLEKIEVNKYYQ